MSKAERKAIKPIKIRIIEAREKSSLVYSSLIRSSMMLLIDLVIDSINQKLKKIPFRP